MDEQPPTLPPIGSVEKPIHKMPPEEITIRKQSDLIATKYIATLEWNLRPPFACPAEMHISNRIQRAIMESSRDIERAKSYLSVPTKLLEDLMTIKRFDTSLYAEFKTNLEEVEFERYYGVREEIAAARSLIIKGLSFKHPDPPDFVFEYANQELKMECTSAHVETSDDYMQKITNKISDKATKPYANRQCILVMDITNIIHNVVGQGGHPAPQILKQRVKEDAEIFDWEFGSIILITYMLNPDNERFERNYLRCDTTYTEGTILNFLEEHFPEEDHSLDEFYIGGET